MESPADMDHRQGAGLLEEKETLLRWEEDVPNIVDDIHTSPRPVVPNPKGDSLGRDNSETKPTTGTTCNVYFFFHKP